MPRPRTMSDEDILAATAGVLRARGPHAFTLADVASAVGLSPATLVQRFGTKKKLLLAFARHAASRAGEALAATDGPRGLAALRAALVTQADAIGGRTHAANDLAMLLEDVRDPGLRAHARAFAERSEAAIAAHLEAAVAARELVPVDAHALAGVVRAAYDGALVGWAVRAPSSMRAGTWVGRVLDALFAPLATRRRAAKGERRRT